MSPKKSENTIRTALFLALDTVEKLQQVAKRKGTTISGIIRMIILEYLTKKE